MDPFTGTVVTTASKAGLTLVFQEVGRRLAPDEAKRVRRALAKAIVAPDQTPDSKLDRWVARARLPFGGPNEEQRVAIQKLEDELTSVDLLVRQPGTEGSDRLALVPWRERLEESLRKHADPEEASEQDRRAWSKVLGGQDPESWASTVARTFEAALRSDPELRFLIACLEWGDQQAATFALVTSADKMQAALWRIAAVLGAFATGLTIASDQLVHLV
jgi:hypothetical protein